MGIMVSIQEKKNFGTGITKRIFDKEIKINIKYNYPEQKNVREAYEKNDAKMYKNM